MRMSLMRWGPSHGQAAQHPGTMSRLEQVYESFGRDGLTPHEHEVLRLVLRGH